MGRRRLLVAVALGLAAGLVFWVMLPRPGVTRENYERIHEGMPLAEVEAIIGRKADYQFVEGLVGTVHDVPLHHIWLEGGGFFDEGTTSVWVRFKPDFTVRDTGFHEPPLAYRLRRLLPW